MSSRRASLALVLLSACLPENPSQFTTSGAADTAGSSGEPPTTGDPVSGLFACASPPCKLVLVSQSLDDRIDIYDVTGAPSLRGRISLDLKPDPSGQQISGNLLDEPYELALTATDLIVTVGSDALRKALSRTDSPPIVATLLPRLSYERILSEHRRPGRITVQSMSSTV